MHSRFSSPTIFIYDEPAVESFRAAEVAAALRQWLPAFKVEVRGEFFAFHLDRLSPPGRERALDAAARRFAAARVRDPFRPAVATGEPLPGEVAYERRRLAGPARGSFGILYDGSDVLAILQCLIPAEESGLDTLHLVFTNQLVGTLDDQDGRYHVRAGVFGFPAVVSIPGLVEGPARPRSYYLLKRQYEALGFPEAEEVALAALEPEGERPWLEHGDPRLTEVLKGYALQAVTYAFAGDAFCPEPACRLYNAHWQEEVIRAQLASSSGLCARHRSLLQQLATAAAEWERGAGDGRPPR